MYKTAKETLENKKLKTIQQPKNYASVDGALNPTGGIIVLNKGSAGAYTLAAPTAAQDGLQLLIVSESAFAHVITATNLIEDGVAGGAKDTATFGAFRGASLSLVAIDGLWHVLAKNVVTIAAV